jgi:MFS family permease
MARTLLVRGMLAGLAAGLVALAFAAAFGEPQVAAAIRVEDAHAAAEGASHGSEPVSRVVQATLGLSIAVAVFGAAVGGVFGLAFGFVNGRFGHLSPRATALGVAAVGFVAGALVPFLKYPANPPGVESTMDMGPRTSLYFLMLLISVLAAVGALIAGRTLAPRWGTWNAATAAAVGFVVVVGVAAGLLPDVSSRVAEFPAELLWRFRVASVGTQAVLWASLGLVFGAMTERAETRAGRRPARATEPV